MKAKKEEKMEIIGTTNNEIANTPVGFGLSDQIGSRDMIIPKILLTQKMSDAVDEGTAQEGDFIDSLDGINFGKSFEGQVFFVGKMWRIFKDEEKKDYDRSEPVTPENDDYDYKFKDLVYQFSLLEQSTRQPYGISMTKTSSQTARRMISMFQKKNGTAFDIITFTGKKEKNEKGSWMSWDFSVSRPATNEEILQARGWYDSMQRGTVKHHEDEPKEVAPTSFDSDDLAF